MMNEPMIDASAKALMEHAGFVRALARSILFDQDAAEDVTQEALLAALKRGGLGKLSLRAWLGRVARNLSLRENRGVGRRRRREQRSAKPEGSPAAAEVVARLEMQRRVVDAVLSLDEPYRTVIVRRYFDEQTPLVIARELGVPVETVRTRIKRALVRLRETLQADHGRDRHAFMAALIPLVGLEAEAAAAAVPAAGLLASAQAKLVLTGWVLAVATLSLWPVLADPGEATVERAASDHGEPMAFLPGEEQKDAAEPRPKNAEPPLRETKGAIRIHTGVPGAKVTLRVRYYGGTPDPEPMVSRAGKDGVAGFDPPERVEPLFRVAVEVRADGFRTVTAETGGGELHVRLNRGEDIELDHGWNVPVESLSDGRWIRRGKDGRADTYFHAGGAGSVRPWNGTSSLSGTVRLHGGAPVADVWLYVARTQGRKTAEGLELNFTDFAVTRTDAQGRYRFEGLQAGKVRVGLRTGFERRPDIGGGGGSTLIQDFDAGKTDADFALSMHQLRIRVVDDQGLPFRHAEVKTWAGGNWQGGTTGEDGYLATLFGAESVKFTVQAPEYHDQPREVKLSGPPRVHDVEVVLRRAGLPGSLRLWVKDDRGLPLDEVRIRLRDDARAGVPEFEDRAVELDDDGSALLTGVPVGVYGAWLSATPMFDGNARTYLIPANHAAVKIEAGVESRLEVTLRRGGHLRLTVRDALGDVIAPGTIVVRNAKGWNVWVPATILSKAEPVLSSVPLAPGTYVVELLRGEAEVVVSAEVRVEAERTTNVELRRP